MDNNNLYSPPLYQLSYRELCHLGANTIFQLGFFYGLFLTSAD
jgi:hypothetical protein